MNQDFVERCQEAADRLASIRIIPVPVLTSETKALKLCELLM